MTAAEKVHYSKAAREQMQSTESPTDAGVQPRPSNPGQLRRPRRKPRLTYVDLCFIAIMFTVNFEYIFVRLFDFDTVLKPYRILAVIGVALAFPEIVRRWGKLKHYVAPLALSLGYAAAVSVALVLAGEARGSAVLHQFMLFSAGIGGFMCATMITSRGFRLGMFALFVGLGLNLAYAWVIAREVDFRALGFFRNPNHFGAALGILCLYLSTVMSRTKRRGFMLVGVLLVLLIGVFSTGSRGALLAVLLAMMLGAIRDRGVRIAVLALVAAGSLVVFVFGADIQKSLVTFQDGRLAHRFSLSEINRASYRKELALAAVDLGMRTAFVGVGLDQFRVRHYYDLVTRLDYFDDRYGHSLGIHNTLLILIVEWGFPAALLMFLFVRRLLVGLGRRGGAYARFAGGVVLMYVFVALTADVFQYLHAWLMLGVAVAVLHGGRSRPAASTRQRANTPGGQGAFRPLPRRG